MCSRWFAQFSFCISGIKTGIWNSLGFLSHSAHGNLTPYDELGTCSELKVCFSWNLFCSRTCSEFFFFVISSVVLRLGCFGVSLLEVVNLKVSVVNSRFHERIINFRNFREIHRITRRVGWFNFPYWRTDLNLKFETYVSLPDDDAGVNYWDLLENILQLIPFYYIHKHFFPSNMHIFWSSKTNCWHYY